MLDTRCTMHDAGYKIQDARYRMRDVRCWDG